MEASRDLAALSVPLAGELVAMDDPWEPWPAMPLRAWDSGAEAPGMA